MISSVSHRSFHYQSELTWKGGRRGTASIQGKPDVSISSPAEFQGEAAYWSPEDMLVTALNACLMMTFLAYAQREELDLASYQSSGDGALEFANGKYHFTEVILRPRLTLRTEEDAVIARVVLENAHRDCIITNSITASVKLEPAFCVEA
jgi:peroxiredoxin-like protein